MPHELVVLSGKGGTGKTSVTAALASLAGPCVLADCDVDAADLHLVLQPELLEHRVFHAGGEAEVLRERCTGCGLCVEACRFEALKLVPDGGSSFVAQVEPFACEGCGLCVDLCPAKAMAFPDRRVGVHFVSRTVHGPMAHARLDPGGENSGRLVTLVREEARRLAQEQDMDFILVDGPPGLGCPVVATLTGASEVLFVAEPSVAGLHDLGRSLELSRHFRVPARLVVNRWDLSLEATEKLEARAVAHGATLLGRIPWDPQVTRAQLAGRSVVDLGMSPAAEALIEIWKKLDPTRKGSRP